MIHPARAALLALIGLLLVACGDQLPTDFDTDSTPPPANAGPDPVRICQLELVKKVEVHNHCCNGGAAVNSKTALFAWSDQAGSKCHLFQVFDHSGRSLTKPRCLLTGKSNIHYLVPTESGYMYRHFARLSRIDSTGREVGSTTTPPEGPHTVKGQVALSDSLGELTTHMTDKELPGRKNLAVYHISKVGERAQLTPFAKIEDPLAYRPNLQAIARSGSTVAVAGYRFNRLTKAYELFAWLVSSSELVSFRTVPETTINSCSGQPYACGPPLWAQRAFVLPGSPGRPGAQLAILWLQSDWLAMMGLAKEMTLTRLDSSSGKLLSHQKLSPRLVDLALLADGRWVGLLNRQSREVEVVVYNRGLTRTECGLVVSRTGLDDNRDATDVMAIRPHLHVRGSRLVVTWDDAVNHGSRPQALAAFIKFTP